MEESVSGGVLQWRSSPKVITIHNPLLEAHPIGLSHCIALIAEKISVAVLLHVFSRPRRSHGLLYKHLRDSFIN